MNRIISKKFDDRITDKFTGKKISPSMEDRRICQCCGLRIVKGHVLQNAGPIGDDCFGRVDRAAWFFQTMEAYIAFEAKTNNVIPPRIAEFINTVVYS